MLIRKLTPKDSSVCDLLHAENAALVDIVEGHEYK